MKFTIASCSLAIVSVALVVAGHVSSAENRKTASPQNEKSPPSFESLCAAALTHNAEVKVAEAQLERARLQVTKEVMSYHQQWQAASATLAAATAELKQAEQDVARLKPLAGAVSGEKLLAAQRQADAARQRAAAAKQQLSAVKSMLAFIVGTPVSAEQEDNATDEQRAAEEMPDSVEKLLQERLRYLTQLAELQREAYQSGETGVDAVLSAQQKVLAAKLELAKTPQDRIEIRQQLLDSARQLENIVHQASRAKVASRADVLSAKAWTLRVEADLERER